MSWPVFFVGYVVGTVLGTWTGLNFAGWWLSRDRGSEPWNWRVLVGPGTYFKWLDRREAK